MKVITEYRASKILYNFLCMNCRGMHFFLPANICEIVPQVFSWAGVSFGFVDIDPNSLCMSAEQLDKVVKPHCGILYVHTYGLEDTPVEWFRQLKLTVDDICIIDDRCLCEPNIYYEPDNNVDLTLFSLKYGKQLDLGEGSFALCHERCSYEQLSTSGLLDTSWMLPSDLDEKIRVAITHRNELNAIYASILPPKIQLPEPYQHWRFNILMPNQACKEKILKIIKDSSSFASSHYKVPVSDPGQYPIAQSLQQRVINLFNDYHFSATQARNICVLINHFLEL